MFSRDRWLEIFQTIRKNKLRTFLSGFTVALGILIFAVMDVMRFELGLKIPDQVSVVGYDDVPVAKWLAYSLTTVRQPANRMVNETVSILIDCIENNSTQPKRVEIDGPLILRGSAKILDNYGV